MLNRLCYTVVGDGQHVGLSIVDAAVALFESMYVLVQRIQEAFDVLRRHDDSGAHVPLGSARHHGDKVKDELVVGMRDDC